jgi:hypothetical protein
MGIVRLVAVLAAQELVARFHCSSSHAAMQQVMLVSENITVLHTSISQSKNLVSNLKAFLGVTAKTLNDPRELHAQRLRRMGGNRVHPHPLQKVHAIQAKCLDFDDGICGFWLRFGSLVVDE